jgi:hypothetical protein
MYKVFISNLRFGGFKACRDHWLFLKNNNIYFLKAVCLGTSVLQAYNVIQAQNVLTVVDTIQT